MKRPDRWNEVGSIRIANASHVVFWFAIFVMAVGVLVGLLTPVNHWTGVRRATLAIEVINRETSEPVAEAEVELIHPYNDEQPPVKGRSAADGRLLLTNRFTASGTEIRSVFRTTSSEYVTFSPWWIRVRAPGFADYLAPLDDFEGRPDWHVTDKPLSLEYPLNRPVTIALRAKSLQDGTR